jgi:hypothetical protein
MHSVHVSIFNLKFPLCYFFLLSMPLSLSVVVVVVVVVVVAVLFSHFSCIQRIGCLKSRRNL